MATKVTSIIRFDIHFPYTFIKIDIAFHMTDLIDRELQDASFAIFGGSLLACYAQRSL